MQFPPGPPLMHSRRVLVTMAMAAWLTACASVEHVGWRLVTTPRPALMQTGGQRLEGVVNLRPDRTGDMILSGTGSIASCAGSLRLTSVTGGAMDMRCSDGAMFAMQFVMVNEVRGYAFGLHGEATAALTFGMDAPEAQAYLSRATPPASP
ncbi:hypothetical protein os4_20770 [Comamonadaceae bacterium OS-4]|nr:hypothetical protein os4_20770 [Comamonadaceae bacterium OS-4]